MKVFKPGFNGDFSPWSILIGIVFSVILFLWLDLIPSEILAFVLGISILVCSAFALVMIKSGFFDFLRIIVDDKGIKGPENLKTIKSTYQLFSLSKRWPQIFIEFENIDLNKSFKRDFSNWKTQKLGSCHSIKSKNLDKEILLHWSLGKKQIQQIENICKERA